LWEQLRILWKTYDAFGYFLLLLEVLFLFGGAELGDLGLHAQADDARLHLALHLLLGL